MAGAEAPPSADFAIAERIVRAAGIERALTGVSEIGEGVKARVLRLDFEHGEPLALKLYVKPDAARRELGAYAVLGSAVPQVPKVVSSALGFEGAPHGYLLMSLAPGTPMNTKLADLGDAQLVALYREIGELLARFHAVELPHFWPLLDEPGRGFDDNVSWFDDRVVLALRAFRENGANRYLAWCVERWFAEHRAGLDECPGPRFCHGDMHPANLRVAEVDGALRIVGALDLEISFGGDPAMDLVRTHHHRFPPRADLWRAMLDGYGDPPPWLDRVFDAYWLYHEIEIWNFFAGGGSRGATRSIARRIARLTGASRWRILRSRMAALVSRQS
ncbi:MAG: aminoglycoside phosphotransferase family protein [Solirubrobacterales bacterium]